MCVERIEVSSDKVLMEAIADCTDYTLEELQTCCAASISLKISPEEMKRVMSKIKETT